MTVETIDPTMPQPPAKPDSISGDVLNVVRGFCMGAADTVPGVSGGTVALILGHYTRLITAISHCDATLVGLLAGRQWRSAWQHLDARFLSALALGIATGIVTLSGVMHWLLDHRMPETLSVFLGLVLVSVWIVRRHVRHWGMDRYAMLLLGAAIAVGITQINPAAGDMSLPMLFVSASVAICAMILPGISGAFVLLLLGIYHPVTGLVKDAAKGNITVESATQIIVFAAGCGFGLIAFSRVLRYLLARYNDVTMALLMGLMIGSIGKLWPFQVPTSASAALEFKDRQFELVSPVMFAADRVTLIVALGLAAGAAVIALEYVASKGVKSPSRSG